MTPERHAQIKQVFLDALDQPPDTRDAWLDAQCGSDKDLRDEVAKLLSNQVSGTLGVPAAESTEPGVATSVSAKRRFDPGTVVGGRYRIVSLLGAGGMGEVYRAEDLVLEQTVALKFLAPGMAGDASLVERFRNEVRLARAVTHENACRVYDIGEADGDLFISMEYVEGENLAAVLRQVGRLPQERAAMIARDICFGLAAAHQKGVLHRDLKPANIMLDRDGRPQITDFGLAAVARNVRGLEIFAGTPAYMSPEQLTGREVSVQSDLYCLGLVLYELFTGRAAFEGKTFEEFARLHAESAVRPPSKSQADVSTEVERIILRCLEKDPARRPRSAMEVAGALPGGDPLAEAIASQRTPSPDTVAAAVPAGRVRTGPGTLLGISLVLLALLVVLRGVSPALWEQSVALPPSVLKNKAHKLALAAGYDVDNARADTGFCQIDDAAALLGGFQFTGDSPRSLSLPSHHNILYWYRAEPNPTSQGRPREIRYPAMTTESRVWPTPLPGTVTVAIDATGRLVFFSVVPAASDAHEGAPGDANSNTVWAKFFKLCGLEPSEHNEVSSTLASHYALDRRTAWKGADNIIECAMAQGKPVFFGVFAAEAQSVPVERFSRAARQMIVDSTLLIVILILAVVSIPWAWTNLKARRCDLVGALRLAILVFAVRMLIHALLVDHVADPLHELRMIGDAAVRALGIASLAWLYYIALEPYARGHWPHMLITWTRALKMNFRDPFVGQHLQIGALLGIWFAVLVTADRLIAEWAFGGTRTPIIDDRVLSQLRGGRFAIAGCLGAFNQALLYGLMVLMLLVSLRVLTRRPRAAAVIAVLVLLPIFTPRGSHPMTSWATVGIGGVVLAVWVTTRFGLVSITAALFVAAMLNSFPLTLHLELWFADLSLLAVGFTVLTAGYGFVAARSACVPRRV